jgi:hypothetical protein
MGFCTRAACRLASRAPAGRNLVLDLVVLQPKNVTKMPKQRKVLGLLVNCPIAEVLVDDLLGVKLGKIGVYKPGYRQSEDKIPIERVTV